MYSFYVKYKARCRISKTRSILKSPKPMQLDRSYSSRFAPNWPGSTDQLLRELKRLAMNSKPIVGARHSNQQPEG